MLLADTTSVRTSITPVSGAESLGTMLCAKSFSNSIAGAACSRASRFAGMVETDPFAIVSVSEARVHCADPERTMFHADKLSKHLGSAATWSSAG